MNIPLVSLSLDSVESTPRSLLAHAKSFNFPHHKQMALNRRFRQT